MKMLLLAFLTVFLVLSVVFAVFFSIRQWLANVQIKREWQTVPASVPNLETTTQLKILPLYEEDRAGESFEFGHGVSYLIRTDSATVLMDIGNNPAESPQLPSIQNMKALGIAWEEIDAIVISHPHPDHIGGVKAWQNKSLSFGDFAGDLRNLPIYVPITMTYPGVTLTYSPEPTLIRSDTATTGVISYPEVYPLSLFNPKNYEQGLVINVAGEGLVVITGCGHPTMERLVSRAEALYGKQVVGVVGGLHYEKTSAEDVQPHIQFLEPRQPRLIALSPHDSSQQALAAFQAAFPGQYQLVRVGEAIQFP